eukprot:1832865-Pyramimonas_sp.AAC.1
MVRPCTERAATAKDEMIINWVRFTLNAGCFLYPPKNHCRPLDGKIGRRRGPQPEGRHSSA